MMHFGIPYKGSKQLIAADIIKVLPRGNRLVDLFGGGFAISHAALLSQKWNEVLYNDIEPLLIPLIRQCLNGDYDYDKYKPEFVTRDDFFKWKDKYGFYKYIWSYGNCGETYLYGEDSYELKLKSHRFVVDGIYDPILDPYDVKDKVNAYTDITKRRLAFCDNEYKDKLRLVHLERIERIQQIAKIPNKNLQLCNYDYREYEYKEGDVVYADIPYEDVKIVRHYNVGFNTAEFYDLCYNADFPIFFSNYEISDKRFKCIWTKKKLSSFKCRDDGVRTFVNEMLFWNGKGNYHFDTIPMELEPTLFD